MTENLRTTLPAIQLVLFGAAGDLSQRLILPALYNLYLDARLPERFLLLGVDRLDWADEALQDRFLGGVTSYSRRGPPAEADWQAFAAHIRYLQMDLTDAQAYTALARRLAEQDSTWAVHSGQLFYMATPPSLFTPIAAGLGGAGLARQRERTRLVVEKPLGHDLESFRAIDRAIGKHFAERQVFRIDHFLGKETVQNILALRFANPMFEPIWNRRYVDHVAITVAETLGVEHRGAFYEHAGALRDMVQNHLLQLLCLVAMEPPVAYEAEDIRGKKLEVLRALRPISRDDVGQVAARGQYGPGQLGAARVAGYRAEPSVDPQSGTETFAALKLQVDNWRWQEVPFYLRTGKRMAAAFSEISVRFKDVPHRAFPAESGLNVEPARLVIRIQPEEGIVLKFVAKEPGAVLRLSPVNMRFSYREAFRTECPAAYETLLWDAMIGDATLFMRADQVEAAWRLLGPLLEVWADSPARDFPNYPAGSWGPHAAGALLARDGRSWLNPTEMILDAPS